MKMLFFDNHMVEFDENIKFQTYDDKYCYGIKFWIDNVEYELIHNRQVNWSRIFVRDGAYSLSDIPFNERTLDLIPNVVIRKL